MTGKSDTTLQIATRHRKVLDFHEWRQTRQTISDRTNRRATYYAYSQEPGDSSDTPSLDNKMVAELGIRLTQTEHTGTGRIPQMAEANPSISMKARG